MRKIVLVRPHEWLQQSYASSDFSVAAPQLAQLAVPGVTFLPETPAPVPMGVGDAAPPPASPFSYMTVAEVDSEDAADALAASPEVDGVFADPEVGPFPIVCPGAGVGGVADVRTQINIAPVHAAGHRGTGVRIAVVDTGIDGGQIPNVVGGYNHPQFPAPGTSPPSHGTMVAFDAQIAAPNASILDYPLLRSQAGGGWIGFLSDAIRMYADLMTQVLSVPGPLVVVNSWGMYDRSSDRPVGNPQNYSANPAHPFNQILAALVGSGADVVFAAGNCGSTCPSGRCGVNDRGPGKSIHGANSHPLAISVAAVTHTGDRLGYSSEGPGGLHQQAPDIAGTSHFQGSNVGGNPDTGTSAACPVVAGVVAALRSKPSAKTKAPAAIKQALLNSAVQPAGVAVGWNAQTGFGIVDAAAAHALV
jgi:hypothetical protein